MQLGSDSSFATRYWWPQHAGPWWLHWAVGTLDQMTAPSMWSLTALWQSLIYFLVPIILGVTRESPWWVSRLFTIFLGMWVASMHPFQSLLMGIFICRLCWLLQRKLQNIVILKGLKLGGRNQKGSKFSGWRNQTKSENQWAKQAGERPNTRQCRVVEMAASGPLDSMLTHILLEVIWCFNSKSWEMFVKTVFELGLVL